tara:strand:+ start:1399 stop:2004 length:606 start_codon:yes stop_codon:yes gene_type:complete
MSSHTEIYFSGENNRSMYEARSSQAIAMFNEVKAVFPWAQKDDAFAISSSLQHEVLGEPVISFTLTNAVTTALVGAQYTLTTRKFCMTSNTSFLKVYPVWDESYPSFLPAGCTVLFKGEHRVELGRPAPSGLDNFYDCYFKGDPETVESHFSLPERRGEYDTFYGVTVKDGAVVRKKQYVYDSSSMFTDWDVIHMMQKRRA